MAKELLNSGRLTVKIIVQNGSKRAAESVRGDGSREVEFLAFAL
jgi:hypothetical protein